MFLEIAKWHALHSLSVCPVKGKGTYTFIAPLCETPPHQRSGMECVLKGSHGFTCKEYSISHHHVYPQLE